MTYTKHIVAPSTGMTTLRELVTTISGDLSARPAFTSSVANQYETMTYGMVAESVRALSTAMAGLGLGRGQRVALLSENRSEWALVYLSVVAMGAVIVPLDSLLEAQELLPVLDNSAAELVFVSAGQKAKIDAIRPQLKAVRNLVVFDEVQETRRSAEKNEARTLVKRLLELDIIPAFIKDAFAKHKGELAVTDKTRVVAADGEYLDFVALEGAGRELLAAGDRRFDDAQVNPDDLAALIYTSGTTGTPKGVMLSHRNLTTDADCIQMIDVMRPEDKWVHILPMHHTFPTIGMLVSVMTRGQCRFMATLRPDQLIAAFRDFKATSIVVVPVFLEKIHKSILKNVRAKGPIATAIFGTMMMISRVTKRLTGLNPGRVLFRGVREKLGLSNLKYFVCGGGPISRSILKSFDIMGIFVAQGYGLTETSPTASCNSIKYNRFGSVGLPLPLAEIRIDMPDAKGNGEILIRAPYLMQGYYHMPDKTAEVVDAQGWFHTGDIGRQDAAGYLWITGRMKNIIVTSGGKNIYPEEIETLLLASDFVNEVVVLGRMDWKTRAEVPYAIIHPNLEAMALRERCEVAQLGEHRVNDILTEEVRRLTKDIASYKKLSGFDVAWEELPKTSKKSVKRFLFPKK